MSEYLLEVENLKKHFAVRTGLIRDRSRGSVKAVDGISFKIRHGQTFGLVGESGCGKTTIAKVLLQLEDRTDGEIRYKGKTLEQMDKAELNEYLFNIQAVFQDPYSSLSPRMRTWEIISEPMATTGRYTKKDRLDRVEELLDIVGLHPESARMYPHEFSGGQRQRVAIARALSINPQLIILDEPVSALDVSFQAQILNLLEDIQDRFGITYLIISHDLAVVEHIGDVIGVMYLGKIVELAPAKDLYETAQHPYSRALLDAVPIPDPDIKASDHILGGEVPSPLAPPPGCHFHPRCPVAKPQCSQQAAPLRQVGEGHFIACHP